MDSYTKQEKDIRLEDFLLISDLILKDGHHLEFREYDSDMTSEKMFLL